jgi:hypothetical protein
MYINVYLILVVCEKSLNNGCLFVGMLLLILFCNYSFVADSMIIPGTDGLL